MHDIETWIGTISNWAHVVMVTTAHGWLKLILTYWYIMAGIQWNNMYWELKYYMYNIYTYKFVPPSMLQHTHMQRWMLPVIGE